MRQVDTKKDSTLQALKDYGEVLKAEFFGAVTGAKDMALTEACAAYDVLNQTASFFADICTFGKFHDSCKDFSDWSHDFLRNIAPYKEGFDDAEFFINTALLADGLLSVSNIVRNFPKKFSIGQISLAELGINMPVLCSDGSIALATPGDLASIGRAEGAFHNMESNSSSGSEGNKSGETSSTKKGKQVHKERADERRKSGDYDTVNEALKDNNGKDIEVPKRVDKQGRPSKKYQKAIPDAVQGPPKGNIIDDKPLGRPISKDKQEIRRFIDAYTQKYGEPPKNIIIERYDPITGEPAGREIYSIDKFKIP